MSTGNETAAVCQQCRSDCDCPTDRYCSKAPNTAGFCIPFRKTGGGGDSCVAMTDAELLNTAISDEYKCAAFFNDPQTGAKTVDWKGFCYGFQCYPCDSGPVPASSSLPPTVSPCGGQTVFNGPRRVCIVPGIWIGADNMNWNPAIFLANTSSVWLAIIWSFMMVFGFLFLFFALSNRRQRVLRNVRSAGSSAVSRSAQ